MFILIFSLPRGSPTLGVKVNRALRGMGAEKLASSVWRSEDLRALTEVAVRIRGSGGSARILEEKIVY